MNTAYDEIAEQYDAALRAGSPVHAVSLPAVFDLLGDVSGQEICDLACGQGLVARELARRGARVTGIDSSARLLEIARRYEAAEPLGMTYSQEDAQTLADVSASRFDAVVCHLALMELPDLPAALNTVARILRPRGRFVFAVTHPCFQTPDSRWTGKAGGTVKREVRGYFNEGFWRSDNPGGIRGQVGAYHRTLSTYLNALADSRLIVERVSEPQPQDEVGRRVPGYQEAPVVLAARCRKRADG